MQGIVFKSGEAVRVNAVRPGFIATDIHASGGTPEEVANAILWLLSDEASYTSGAFIDIAGGR